MSPQDKVALHLPKFFKNNVNDMICEFLESRLIFTKPHMLDDHDTLFNPNSLNPKITN